MNARAEPTLTSTQVRAYTLTYTELLRDEVEHVLATEWANGEGYDITFTPGNGVEQRISLSYAQVAALELLLARVRL